MTELSTGPTERASGKASVPALSVRGLVKRFGKTDALGGVDIEVQPGQLVGLLGPNGAGKSTLTKIACGLVRPTSGDVEIFGAGAGSRQACRAIGYLAELFRYPSWLTAGEVIRLHQRLAGSGGGAGERGRLLERVGLSAAAGKRVGAMSKGMQQRLGVAQALVGSPRLLLLDEPTSALDPGGRRDMRFLLEELRSEGVAVLLNSHLLSEVELVCDHVVIVDRGHVVEAGRLEELARPRGVEIELAGGARLFEGMGRDEVPELVERLVAEGERIYGVRVRSATLEEVYLDVVVEDSE
ncbi:MAG: ABC transporter ATP-binding protein [Gaiellaceae bacterium]